MERGMARPNARSDVLVQMTNRDKQSASRLSQLLYSLIDFFFYRERGRGRERERERETLICCSPYLYIHWLLLICALNID